MTKLCEYCGTSIPKDDARFCSACGRHFAPEAANASASPGGPTPAPPQSKEAKGEPELRSLETKKPEKPVEQAVPLPETSDDEVASETEAIEDRPTLLMKPSPDLVQDEALSGEDLEDRPTLLLKPAPHPASSKEETPAQDGVPDEDRDAERLATALLPPVQGPAATPSSKDAKAFQKDVPASPAPPFRSVSQNPSSLISGGPIMPIPPISSSPATPIPPIPSPQPLPPVGSARPQPNQAGYQPASTPSFPSGPATTAVPPARPVRPSPRLLIVFAGLALVLLVGTVLVVPLTQQSANSPWQSFSNASLGFSTHYPVDWQVKSDTKKSQVQFSDDNQTAIFTVTVTNAGNADAQQFVQQQASNAHLSDIQAAQSISFAGVTWQVVEGNLSTEGVSYHVQFLAAKHGNHLYLVTQQALKANYANNERVFFSQMRSVWQFTS